MRRAWACGWCSPRFTVHCRDPNPHVAFGSSVHHCLGATLARLEGQEVCKALAERLPHLHLETEELAW
jgi:pimeloyl-[acyl-carrier protein] synthase